MMNKKCVPIHPIQNVEDILVVMMGCRDKYFLQEAHDLKNKRTQISSII